MYEISVRQINSGLNKCIDLGNLVYGDNPVELVKKLIEENNPFKQKEEKTPPKKVSFCILL